MKVKFHLVWFIILLLLCSCTSMQYSVFHKKIKPSAEINAKSVPLHLIEAFQNKYPGVAAEKWYHLNTHKYAVSFQKGGVYKYAYFTEIGIFQDEEIDQELYYDPYDEYDWDEIPDEYN